jgi:hypothetical protein
MNVMCVTRLGLALGLALALSGSALAGADELARIHTIGVIARLADQTEIKKVGLFAFNNKTTRVDTANWKLDDEAAADVVAGLSPQFQAKPIAVPDLEFARAVARLYPDSIVRFGPAIPNPPPADVDAYLVVWPAARPLPYGLKVPVMGLGAGRILGGLPNSEPFAYAAYAVYLIDAKTGKMLAASQGLSPEMKFKAGLSRFYTETPWPFPRLKEDLADWSDSSETMSDDQKQALHRHLSELLKASIPYTLQQMGLGPVAQEPQAPSN